MKVVVNRCYGGFGLSMVACDWLLENGFDIGRDVKDLKRMNEESRKKYGLDRDLYSLSLYDDKKRADPVLVRCVEELGKKSFGAYAELEIVEIPDGVDFEIEEYDGMESVHEKHRSW